MATYRIKNYSNWV